MDERCEWGVARSGARGGARAAEIVENQPLAGVWVCMPGILEP